MAKNYAIEPFLVFTEFLMDKPVFGPHPHAGISVMTYILPDSPVGFMNRDSAGDQSIIEPGGLHITQAGSGIHHDEFPLSSGVDVHGFQIWINHADKDRFVGPKAMHAMAHEIPEITQDEFKVRIIHGAFQEKKALHQMLTPVTLLHIFLQAGKSISLNAEEMAFVYCLNGAGASDDTQFSAQNLLVFEQNIDSVTLKAGQQACEFMFATGKPLGEPIVYGGPFVMTTPEQMATTRRNYAEGKMGTLAPYQHH